jgi:hypothetical protein
MAELRDFVAVHHLILNGRFQRNASNTLAKMVVSQQISSRKVCANSPAELREMSPRLPPVICGFMSLMHLLFVASAMKGHSSEVGANDKNSGEDNRERGNDSGEPANVAGFFWLALFGLKGAFEVVDSKLVQQGVLVPHGLFLSNCDKLTLPDAQSIGAV